MMPGRPPRSRLVALTLVVLAPAVVVLVGCSAGHHPTTPPVTPATPSPSPTVTTPTTEVEPAAQAWDVEAGTAFTPLTTALPPLDKVIDRLRAGGASDPEVQAASAAAIGQIVATRARIQALPPFPDDARVNGLYLDSVLLDLQAANTDAAAIALPGASARRDQVILLGMRLRRLADRVFDRGHALVQPHLGSPDPNLVLNLPEEVPNWTIEGLAAGPPLDPSAPAVRPLPESTGELRVPDRPTQSRAGWLEAVRTAAIPDSSTLAAAVETSPPDAGLAHAFLDAAERLRAAPDPVGDREVSARLRLGLLISADAVYASRAASLAPPDAAGRLRDVAGRLVLVTDHLWPPDAGPRSSGLPSAWLNDDR